jgi:hypothetical protein
MKREPIGEAARYARRAARLRALLEHVKRPDLRRELEAMAEEWERTAADIKREQRDAG